MNKRPYLSRNRPILVLLSLLLPVLFLWQIKPSQPVKAQTCQLTHLVQAGENLYRIALKYGVSQQEIAQLNGLVNYNLIEAGQRLCLPASAQTISENSRFAMSRQPVWESLLANKTTSLAWGDVDNDGDLDLAVGNSNFIGTNPQEPALEDSSAGQRNYLYLNVNGQLDPTPVWSSEPDSTQSLAWGDYNGDGFLDLAVGNYGEHDKVYLNRDGVLSSSPDWTSEDKFWTTSIAWADLNGDGLYDLVVRDTLIRDAYVLTPYVVAYYHLPAGNSEESNQMFTSGVQLDAVSEISPLTLPLLINDDHEAWEDIDGNGQLDRIQALFGGGLDLDTDPFANLDGLFRESLLPEVKLPTTVALGDGTGNGSLELAVGLFEGEAQIFRFTDNNQTPELLWQSQGQGGVEALSWGDVDGDGDLDLAVGGPNKPVRLYRNETDPYMFSATIPTINMGNTSYLGTWGDSNNDGFYDLLQSSIGKSLQVLQNGYGRSSTSLWQPSTLINQTHDYISDATWADIDNDQDLDLIVGNSFAPNQLFRRQDDGRLLIDSSWIINDTEATRAVAWGDVDGDGDLDLAVGNASSGSIPRSNTLPPSIGHDQLYLNDGGKLSTQPGWQSTDTAATVDVHWWDYDGDGDLDLIATTDQQPNSDRLYLNNGGVPQDEALLIPHQTRWDGADYLDVNGDGRPDFLRDGTLFLHNHTPIHPQFPGEESLNIALVEPAKIAPAATAVQGSYDEDGILAITYQISGPIQQKFDVFGYFSLDGGDSWQPAKPTEDSATRNLASGQTKYTYTWDIFSSGVYGSSDNTRFRLQVRPSNLPQVNGMPGLYQRPFAQTETLPFRIRGKQVRVLNASGTGLSGAVVYRLPANQTTANLQTNLFGQPFNTNSQGYLAGRDVIGSADQFLALWPVPVTDTADLARTDTTVLPFTESYTLFYTSGAPTEAGVAFTPTNDAGVQTLTVSPDNKLLLFHLNVSLEWDARNDPLFMLELEESFKQASALLYDVTNGQVALGQINLFHNKAYWGQADVVIYADNGLRPSAAIGGIVNQPIADPGVDAPIAYVPGQIRMGTVWDPYGERTAELGQDWTRALAHELSHYLLFLPDNYLGLKPFDDADPSSGDVLQRVDCRGSFMTNTADPAYSEFLTETKWNGDCQTTLADKTTGRPDWETITTFYPMLSAGQLINGPANLPLAVTYLIPWAFDEQSLPFPSRNFDLRDANDDNKERLRLTNSHAYLFQTNNPDDLTDDVLLPLGTPTGGGDRLKVRGALPNDRLCVFGSNNGQPYAGCLNPLSAEDASILVGLVSGNEANGSTWQPQISVTAVTSRTFTIEVEQTLSTEESLHVQLFPLHYGSVPCNAPVATMLSNGRFHTQTLTTRLPAYEVAVHIWTDKGNGRESVTTYRLDPPWDTPNNGANPSDEAAGCDFSDESLANLYPINDLAYAPIGGPNNVPVGGPNNVPVGGPNNVPVGGPNNVPVGGPNNVPVGGPNNVPVGGPNNVPVGGASNSFNAPILSADAQVVVYSQKGFFAPNGIKSLQVLAAPPALENHQWLMPVGRSYRVTLENNAPDRFISIGYLQRDVPEGYEDSLAVYFLPDGEAVWQRLQQTEQFVENFVVAPLQTSNGTYAVMATIEMPALEPGWNLLAYPLPDCRSVDKGLSSIIDQVDGISLARGSSRPPTFPAMNTSLTLEPGYVYWVHNNSDTLITPYFAPPERQTDGTFPACSSVTHGNSNGSRLISRLNNAWVIGGIATAVLFALILLIFIRQRRRRN